MTNVKQGSPALIKLMWTAVNNNYAMSMWKQRQQNRHHNQSTIHTFFTSSLVYRICYLPVYHICFVSIIFFAVQIAEVQIVSQWFQNV